MLLRVSQELSLRNVFLDLFFGCLDMFGITHLAFILNPLDTSNALMHSNPSFL